MSGVLCPQGGNLPTLTGSATVTVGLYTPIPTVSYYGFSFGAGSVTPTLWGSSASPYVLLCWTDLGIGNQVVYFSVGGYVPNGGWTTLTINGTPFNRVDATVYSYDANANQTSWYWYPIPSNPYGTTIGATKVVTWS